MAESFVGTLKCELVKGRVYRSRFEAEIAVVEWIGWFNHRRLHTELGDIPPAEFKARHAEAGANPHDRSVAEPSLRAEEGRTAARLGAGNVDHDLNAADPGLEAPIVPGVEVLSRPQTGAPVERGAGVSLRSPYRLAPLDAGASPPPDTFMPATGRSR
jgi:Integrase core domain